MGDPASIRTNNPGAMWGGKHAEKWGATDDVVLHDGQHNHIAVFPTKVQGAAAQFDLWRRLYSNMTLTTAIKRWSGENSSAAYSAYLVTKTGIGMFDIINEKLLAGPKGIALMKAQAAWECGRIKDGYPMTDAEWAMAQHTVFPGISPAPPPDIPAPSTALAPVAQATPGPGGFGAFLRSIFGSKA